MRLLHLATFFVCAFCVKGKLILNPVDWRFCCPKCPWKWPYESKQKAICQMYKDVQYYATLYSTTHRIPLFSQFNLSRNSMSFPQVEFAVEPQLINLNVRASQNMQLEQDLTPEQRTKLGHNQATLEDYREGPIYDKGHLSPAGGHDREAATNATYTLTNAVPQVGSFNQGCWSYSEEATRKYVKSDCFPNDVVVGAIPGFKKKMNDRVNVPLYMWSTIHCQSTVVAFLAPNINNDVIQQQRLMTLFYFDNNILPSFNDDIRALYKVSSEKELEKLVKKLKINTRYFQPNRPAAFINDVALGRCLAPYPMEMLLDVQSQMSKFTAQPFYFLLAFVVFVSQM